MRSNAPARARVVELEPLWAGLLGQPQEGTVRRHQAVRIGRFPGRESGVVYPGFRADLDEDKIILHRSRPPVPKRASVLISR